MERKGDVGSRSEEVVMAEEGKIKIGVCVMEKKVKCGPEVLFSFDLCFLIRFLRVMILGLVFVWF